LERDALKLDLTPDELFAISTNAYYTTDLLRLRMGLLHLNAADVAHSDPRLLQSLETSCRLCDVKGRCSSDIAQNPAHRRWQDYCPNAWTLCDMHTRKI
jgi:hypothetical protein